VRGIQFLQIAFQLIAIEGLARSKDLHPPVS
jgi:hypothetical protein